MTLPPPAPGYRDIAGLVDGNALSGPFADLFEGDASALLAGCGACGTTAVLAEAVVEVDEAAFIVRCRTCTHTLMTLQRMPSGLVLRIEHLASLSGAGAGAGRSDGGGLGTL